jgi:hypothetical protein
MHDLLQAADFQLHGGTNHALGCLLIEVAFQPVASSLPSFGQHLPQLIQHLLPHASQLASHRAHDAGLDSSRGAVDAGLSSLPMVPGTLL